MGDLVKRDIEPFVRSRVCCEPDRSICRAVVWRNDTERLFFRAGDLEILGIIGKGTAVGRQ